MLGILSKKIHLKKKKSPTKICLYLLSYLDCFNFILFNLPPLEQEALSLLKMLILCFQSQNTCDSLVAPLEQRHY